ncbi:MAG: pyridoxamine 5'-phosphate oxidase family protein [Ruegeria sp.]
MAEQSAPSELMRLKRAHKRGHYDMDTIYSVLDATFICHIGYVVDDQPLVVPTAYIREGDTVYIHGSSASRMLRALANGASMAFTVSIVDALVLARSGFEHSINSRSVMAVGTGFEVTDSEHKYKLLVEFVDKVAPGRGKDVRGPSEQEMKATKVIGLKLDNASAKIHTDAVTDEPEDLDIPVWAGVVPMGMDAQPPIRDKDLSPEIEEPSYLSLCPIHRNRT